MDPFLEHSVATFRSCDINDQHQVGCRTLAHEVIVVVEALVECLTDTFVDELHTRLSVREKLCHRDKGLSSLVEVGLVIRQSRDPKLNR
jgi:hypothetical protein